MIVTFCGHSKIQRPEKVKMWLNEVIEGLIFEGADCFYLGGYGQFDALAAAAVKEQQRQHPQIRSVLVLPYLDRSFDTAIYDETVYPPLETVPRRYAILRRNEYMVDAADVVISFVVHSFGGAYKTVCYARRKHKRIIQCSIHEQVV